MIQFQENCWKGWTEGHAQFSRTLLAMAGGPKTEVKVEGAMQSPDFEKYRFAIVQEKIIVAQFYFHFRENTIQNCINKSFVHL